MKKAKTIIFIIIVFAVVASIWYFTKPPTAGNMGLNLNFATATDESPKSNETETKNDSSKTSAPSAVIGTNTYKDPAGRFSFAYPKGYSASSFTTEETGAETVLVQDKKANGFQIVISKLAEPAARLNVVDIETAIPDIKISEAQEFSISGEGGGVLFSSNNEFFGGSARELWFVYKGVLYQASAFAKNRDLIDNLAKSWRFE